MPEKLPWLEKKIDFQTNNPRKLFRTISDLFEDEMSKRGYRNQIEEQPTLESTGIDGVAEFEGYVGMSKIKKSRTKGRILSGILVALIVSPLYGYIITPSLHFLGVPLFIEQLSWAVFPLMGLIIMLSKTRTEFFVSVDLEGEGYQYRGNKEVNNDDIEKRERLDVVSDVRLIIRGRPTLGSYMDKKFKEELSNDLKFLNERLNKIVPEYRIPA